MAIEPGVRRGGHHHSQSQQQRKSCRQPIRRARLRLLAHILPDQAHEDAQRNDRGQKIGGKFGMRKRKEDEDPYRPTQQKQDGPARLLLKFPPAAQAIPARQKQEETPGKEAAEEHRNVVEDSSSAMRGAGRETLQTFVPKGVAGEIRIAQGDSDEPGQGRGEENQKAPAPSQAQPFPRSGRAPPGKSESRSRGSECRRNLW